MKINHFFLALLLFCELMPMSAQTATVDITDRADWWNVQWITDYKPSADLTPLPFIKVEGNHFVDENGETVIFRGLSISDPDKIEKDGHWGKAHFEAIKSWGVNLVRLPVHPVSVHQRGLENYIKLLDDAVNWCTELGMYVIVDWHSIGNLKMEMFQHPMYRTTKAETYEFWKVIARHYKNVPTVAFYEVYNEPTVFDGTLGHCSWMEWKVLVEDIIDIIYAHDEEVIPLVGGFDWAYDLRDIRFNPIARPGVAYVTHPYPGKCEPPREAHWEEHFGFLADDYPIVATELGYYFEGEHHLIEEGQYREAIMAYFAEKGISWCAWVFDPNWHPQLIKNYEYEPTHSGEFFRGVMLELNKK